MKLEYIPEDEELEVESETKEVEDEEIIEETQNEKQTIEEIQERNQKKVISELYKKLEELQEKLINEQLSPLKRFLIENKLSIIETRLERQLAKMEIKDFQKEYEADKDEIYEIHNEELQEKQEELDNIFEEIEEQERLIEEKSQKIRNREADYNEINSVGKSIIPVKKERSTYQFATKIEIDEILQKQQEILEELIAKKDLKKEEIINLKMEFIEAEKTADAEFSKQLKEYKPSIWQSFKNAFSKISANFENWRKNSKQEKEAIKNAKIKARRDSRINQRVEGVTKNTVKMEEFKDKVNYYIPLEEQKKYSKEAQQKIESEEEKIVEENIQEDK